MSATPGAARYTFTAQWEDPHSKLIRSFNLMFFEEDSSVEIYEPSARRTFLKRCEPPEPLSSADFFLGASVTVFSRRLTITAFGDPQTERRFATKRSTTLAIVKPDAVGATGDIIAAAVAAGLDTGRIAMLTLTATDVDRVFGTKTGADKASLRRQLTRGPVVALELVGDDCVNQWHGLMGPSDPSDARAAAPDSLRARFGTSPDANAVYGSASNDDALAELAAIFDPATGQYAGVFRDCTLCIIKPHVVTAKSAGQVLSDVLSSTGLTLSGLRTLQLTRKDAEDYLEAYKGVVAEYSRWVVELSSGTALALLLTGDSAVERLREACGPYIPEVARHLREGTIRAVHGVDTVRNAVQCTDLPLDGPLECKFVFSVLA